jgi:hypothetical protein
VKVKAPGALAKESLLGVTRASEPAASPQPASELPRLSAAGSPGPTATGVPLPKGPAGPASHGPTDELQASGRGPRGASSSSPAPAARRSSASLSKQSLHILPASRPSADFRPLRQETAPPEGTATTFNHSKGALRSPPSGGQRASGQGESYVRTHARASSTGSTRRQAGRLGRIFRGAFAIRASSFGADGRGAPSTRSRRSFVGAAAALLLALGAVSGSVVATAGASTCENESVRAEQHAQLLPECRAWEMTSPLDKNGGNITSEGSNVIAATGGNAVEYVSRAGFADTRGSGPVGLTQYIADRGAGGWATHGISPTPNPGALEILFARDEAGVFSEDLSKAVFLGEDLPGPTDDIPNLINLYQENTLTGDLKTVTLAGQLSGSPAPFDFVNNLGVGASADTEVIAFEASSRLLPEATEGVNNVYEWDHGVLRVAGVLPDGTVPSEGSSQPEANFLYRYRDSVSSDGSRIAFLSVKEGQRQLYLRRDHTSTAWVSEAEGTGVSAPESVRLQWMSPDGRHLLFTTTSKLLPSDGNETSDLYLYTDGANPSSESNLELVSSAVHAASREAGVEGDVLGASDDAGRIYFLTESCGCGEYELAYWDHGVATQIAEHLGGLFSLGSTEYPGEARVSADGLHAALFSERQLTADPISGRQIYVYDATTESLACASCMASGLTEASVPTEPDALPVRPLKEMPEVRPEWLSSDGRHVFFTTAAPLVPDDINGVRDVYVYDTETGEQHLVSSGRGEDPAWFENASASGSDVFIVTSQQLVGKDTDVLWDLYDARVEGGFAEPPAPPTPCSGDGCRGALSSGLEVSSPATSSFSGPGNPHRKAKHHRHKRRKSHGHPKQHKGQRADGAGK